jgi:hypothetical protein
MSPLYSLPLLRTVSAGLTVSFAYMNSTSSLSFPFSYAFLSLPLLLVVEHLPGKQRL